MGIFIIRLFVYNILSVQTHNISNIFLTAVQQNSYLFHQILFIFWWRILRPKKFVKNWKTT